jgi:hypothetical protein
VSAALQARDVTWERDLEALFEELEQQAAGLDLSERDGEVADRSVAEYTRVDLLGRVHASAGRPVTMALLGAGAMSGTVRAAGRDWCLLASGPSGQVEVLVRLAALRAVQGLSVRSLVEEARPISARLGFGSALRRLTEGDAEVVVQHVDGTQSRLWVTRVGADFVEAGEIVLPMSGVAAVRAAVRAAGR